MFIQHTEFVPATQAYNKTGAEKKNLIHSDLAQRKQILQKLITVRIVPHADKVCAVLMPFPKVLQWPLELQTKYWWQLLEETGLKGSLFFHLRQDRILFDKNQIKTVQSLRGSRIGRVKQSSSSIIQSNKQARYKILAELQLISRCL